MKNGEKMKKKRFIGGAVGAGAFVLIVLLVICLLHPIGNLSNKRYALNLYDANMHYTRGIEAFYDRSGALKSIEVYIIYDDNVLGLSSSSDDSDLKYPDAISTCVINDDGSVRFSNFLTAESIEAGALEDKVFFMASSIYDKVKTEEDIKAFLSSQIQLAAENGIPADDKNYIILNNKNAEW